MLQLELLLLLPSTELFVTGACNTPSMRLHPLSIATLSKRRRNYSISFSTSLSNLLMNILDTCPSVFHVHETLSRDIFPWDFLAIVSETVMKKSLFLQLLLLCPSDKYLKGATWIVLGKMCNAMCGAIALICAYMHNYYGASQARKISEETFFKVWEEYGYLSAQLNFHFLIKSDTEVREKAKYYFEDFFRTGGDTPHFLTEASFFGPKNIFLSPF